MAPPPRWKRPWHREGRPVSLWEQLLADLADIDDQALRRVRRSLHSVCGPHAVVDGRPMLAFCSNDYLGLAGEPALAAALKTGAERWGAGSGASHLVSGHYGVHDELEARLAEQVGCERALYFSTGYMANTGVAPPGPGRRHLRRPPEPRLPGGRG